MSYKIVSTSKYDFSNNPTVNIFYEITKEDIYDDDGESIFVYGLSCALWEFKYTINEDRKVIDKNPTMVINY